MDEKFLEAVEKGLSFEGGHVNDPADPGGETNFGISRRTYPDVDIANLTRDEAIEIYFRDWWEKYGYGRIEHPDLGAKVFDLAVNMGPGTVHVMLQLAVVFTGGGNLTIDGVIGPLTIAAVNGHPNVQHLFDKLRLLAIEHYVGLHKPKYLAGWIKRALA